MVVSEVVIFVTTIIGTQGLITSSQDCRLLIPANANTDALSSLLYPLLRDPSVLPLPAVPIFFALIFLVTVLSRRAATVRVCEVVKYKYLRAICSVVICTISSM